MILADVQSEQRLDCVVARVEELSARIQEQDQKIDELSSIIAGLSLQEVEMVTASKGMVPRRSTEGAAGYDVFARAIVDADAQITPENPWRPAKADFLKNAGWRERLHLDLVDKVVDDPNASMKYGIRVERGDSVYIGPGFVFGMPMPSFIDVAGRSGLEKKGLHVTSGRIIDADFRGEVAIRLTNKSERSHTIFHGMRFAQIVFSLAQTPEIKIIKRVKDLPPSDRGASGMGSTGIGVIGR